MKYKLWWLLLIIPLIIALFFLIQNRVKKAELENEAATLTFNSMTQKWEKYLYEDPVEGDRGTNSERIAKAVPQLLLTL